MQNTLMAHHSGSTASNVSNDVKDAANVRRAVRNACDMRAVCLSNRPFRGS